MTDQPDRYAELRASINNKNDWQTSVPANVILLSQLLAERDELLADKRRMDLIESMLTKRSSVEICRPKHYREIGLIRRVDGHSEVIAREHLTARAAIDAAMQAQSEQWTLPPQKQMPEDIAEIINKGLDDGSLYD